MERQRNMISAELVKQTVRLIRGKVWRYLDCDDIYAVSTSDGIPAYCFISSGEDMSTVLFAYIGDQGWNTYLDSEDALDDNDTLLNNEIITRMEVLSCELIPWNACDSGIRKEFTQTADALGEPFEKRSLMPHLLSEDHNRLTSVLSEREQEIMALAMEGAVYLSGKVADGTPKGLLGIGYDVHPALRCLQEIPHLHSDGDSRTWGKHRLPRRAQYRHPVMKYTSLKDIMEIRAMRRDGIWGFHYMHAGSAFQHEDGCSACYPDAILILDLEKRVTLFAGTTVRMDGNHPEEALKRLADIIRKEKTCPAEIRVQDDATFAMLHDMCARTAILLRKVGMIPDIYNIAVDIADTDLEEPDD